MKRTLIPIFLLAASCGTATYKTIRKPEPDSLRDLRSVMAPHVETKKWLDANPLVRDGEQYEKWRTEIELLAVQVPADMKGYLSKKFLLANKAAKDTLLVKTELIHFNPSAGAARKDTIGIRAELYRGDSDELLGSAEVYGTVAVGSFRESFKACGRGLAEFVLDHLKKTAEKKEDK